VSKRGIRNRGVIAVAREASSGRAVDVAGFVSALQEHDSVLRAFAYRLVAADVDDVLQAAYLAAFRALPGFRGDSSLLTWLHRIVYTTALNHLRSVRRQRQDESPKEVGETADVAESTAVRVDLARALEALAIDQRAVLLLVDGAGYSYSEAATVLGVEVGTIASRLSRARRNVRMALSEKEL
jgi:RNA polymerase sigma-70 factor, ECF subfamily